ncbi:hypothetical protein [Sphingomonas sp. 37zxx]|uniref:hypothetical protein n=1 Tax=Sphingomonas sp. 37zxx TaxID=1550073 RepID=UPI0012E015CF|nr:hypothetical protein [Sphingomonas sp. 37zxx]
MAVMTMSDAEISRFDTLMRLDRGELRPAEAMQLLRLERVSEPTVSRIVAAHRQQQGE